MLRQFSEALSNPPKYVAASLSVLVRGASVAAIALGSAGGAFAASLAVDHFAPLVAAGSVMEVVGAQLQAMTLVAVKFTALVGAVSDFLGV